MVLRRSCLMKELHRGTPSTGLRHAARVWEFFVFQTSLSEDARIASYAYLTYSVVSQHLKIFLFSQIFEESPLTSLPLLLIVRILVLRINFSCCAPHWAPVVVCGFLSAAILRKAILFMNYILYYIFSMMN